MGVDPASALTIQKCTCSEGTWRLGQYICTGSSYPVGLDREYGEIVCAARGATGLALEAFPVSYFKGCHQIVDLGMERNQFGQLASIGHRRRYHTPHE